MKLVNLYEYVFNYIENMSEIKKQYLVLLGELTTVSDISNEQFFKNIQQIHSIGQIIVGIEVDIIVCSGTLIIEPKIIHGGKSVGHIEDIVVLPQYRNKGIANELLDNLKQIAITQNCYKIILDCNECWVSFYEKNGFSQKGIQMTEFKK